MYNKIINPKNNKKIKINSKLGINILNKYFKNIYGGKFIGKGAYKCVFSPPITCLNKNKRYKENINKHNNYISAIMVKKKADNEIKELKNIKKIDPNGIFTLPLQKKCKIGLLEKNEESIQEFKYCGNLKDYKYPYNIYNGNKNTDLVQLIFKKGGINLYNIKKKILSKEYLKINIKELFLNIEQIINAIKILIKKRYSHSDIKLGNILYNFNQKKYYLIDFGLSNKYNVLFKNSSIFYKNTIKPNIKKKYIYWPDDSGLSNLILTSKNTEKINKLAKKILKINTNKINLKEFVKNSKEKLDIYSLGITLNKLFNNELIYKQLATENNYSIKKINNIKKKFKNLIKTMINPNPLKRININNLLTNFIKFKKLFT